MLGKIFFTALILAFVFWQAASGFHEPHKFDNQSGPFMISMILWLLSIITALVSGLTWIWLQ